MIVVVVILALILLTTALCAPLLYVRFRKKANNRLGLGHSQENLLGGHDEVRMCVLMVYDELLTLVNGLIGREGIQPIKRQNYTAALGFGNLYVPI